MKKLYDFYQLGRLLKRLYFEGAWLLYSNRENLEPMEKKLLSDSKIINDKAYQLCQKLQFNYLNNYWNELFDIVNNNTKYAQKDFLKKLNNLYKLIAFSIDDDLSNEELVFFQLGLFLSENWIKMASVTSFPSIAEDLKKVSLTNEIKSIKYKSIINILNEILNSIRNSDIEKFNDGIDILINEIKKIDKDREMNEETQGQVNISNLHAENVQVGHQNKMNVNITPAEFIQILEKFNHQPKEKRASIINQMIDFAKSSNSVVSLISELKDLV